MANQILERDITPREVYFNRRRFLQAGIVAATGVATTLVYRRLNRVILDASEMPPIPGLISAPHENGYWVNETQTPRASILNYNNFYEFSTDKDAVAAEAAGFKTDGWKVTVGGLVRKPRVFDMDDIRRISPPEERVYRMRCVEAARHRGAHGRGKVRRVRNPSGPDAHAGPKDRGARLALRRGAETR